MQLPAYTIAQSCMFSHSFDENGKMIVLLKLFSGENEQYASLQYFSAKRELKGDIQPAYAYMSETIYDIALSLCVAYKFGSENTLLEACPEELFHEA